MTTLTVPATLNDLGRHWQGFILQTLKRLGRVKFNAEDVFGYVMLKLCEADVVTKFHAGTGEQNHPLTVSVEEASKMLGITAGDFLAFQVESEDSLTPVSYHGKPVADGLGYTSPKARYLFADVIALSATVTFPNQGVQEMPSPKLATVAQWKQYLTTAVSNHSANYARTHYRRCRLEHAPDAFYQFRTDEGGVEFEARLVDPTAGSASVEQALEVQDLLKEAPGLHTRRVTVMVEGKSTEQNFFDLLGSGYTIREASKAVKLTRQELKVIQTHLGE